MKDSRRIGLTKSEQSLPGRNTFKPEEIWAPIMRKGHRGVGRGKGLYDPYCTLEQGKQGYITVSGCEEKLYF